jgi:hypothetical protein
MARLPKDPRVDAYAIETGISKRTAQDHRKKNDPRWLEFIGGDLDDVEVIVKSIAETAIVAGKTKARAMMDAAFETWQAIETKKRDAINRSRAMDLPSLCKAEMEAQESFRKAKRAFEADELARGGIIMRSDLDGYQKALLGIRRVLEKMPAEVGPRSNPADKQFGILAAREWLEHRFLKEYDAATHEIFKLKTPPPQESLPGG